MATMTSAREIVDSYRAAWNAHDPDACAEHFTPDGVRRWMVVNNPAVHSPDRFEGREDIAEGIRAFMENTPDLRVELGAYAEGEDGAIFEWTVLGTHTGAWGDWQGQGEELELPGVSVLRVVDGRIAEEKMFFDPDMMARNWRPPA
ncbi:MAG: nuclear transport factor 2 family protein [Thermoleophilia bacterium]|nr:nuclear transport factor 2 family protein [Thermoleophilia bacterium]